MRPIVQMTHLLTLVLLAAPAAGAAQPLAAFLDSAARQNVDERLASEARVRADAEAGQAWGALLPSLTASGAWTHNQYDAVLEFPTGQGTSKTVTIIPRNQLEASIRVEVPLIDATKWLQTAATAAGADAAAARTRSTHDQVQRQVVSAYYVYTAANAVLESAHRSLEVSRSQLEVTGARTSAGVANELDLMRARSEVERNAQVVADAESMLATSGRTLRTLSGLEPGTVTGLPVDDLHPAPALETLEQGLGALPQVQAAERDVSAASRTSMAATLALVPTLSAQATERFTNATGFQGQPALFNAGLLLNWRVDVPAVHALRAQRSAELTAQLTAEKVRAAAADQLHADWQKVRAAITKVRAAGAQVVSAARAAALAGERANAGVATQLDVIQAERDRFVSELNDIQARTELASARAALELSSGERK